MKNLFLFVIVILLSIESYAQTGANWYFGNYAGVTWNTTMPNGDPTPLMNGQLNSNEGAASISDPNGSLLFYTDGQTVWNSNHTPFSNSLNTSPGGYLDGDPSSTQSAVIVPKPNDLTVYYIFTVDGNLGPDGVSYSKVDMTLNSGLGDIDLGEKNVQLISTSPEKITATYHANGLDIWVLIHAWNSNQFKAYLVTSNGVQTSTPAISNVGTVTSGSSSSSRGYLKVSPLGNKVAMAVDGGNYWELYDFDNSTGILSNSITLNPGSGSNAYGVEFSPDGNLLYGSQRWSNSLRQWDISSNNSATTIASHQVVATLGSFAGGGLQLAPDDKIYLARSNTKYLGRINNPNSLGTSCNYADQAILLGPDLASAKTCKEGLPNLITYVQPQASIMADFSASPLSAMTGDTISFTDLSLGNPTNWFWDFGDGNTSTLQNPYHIYSNSGSYSVQLIISDMTDSDTLLLNNYIQVNNTPLDAISIYPSNATASDTITLTFYPPLACFESGSLEGADSIAMHSGVTYSNGLEWNNVVEFNQTAADGSPPILHSNGDGTYSITFVPVEYYGVPSNTVVTHLNIVFNNGIDWTTDGRDFGTVGCQDFFVPLEVPVNLSANLVFSEYIEGSSNNKAIEIYNADSQPVDLSNYLIGLTTNGTGNLAFHNFPVGSIITPGDVWVIAADQADTAILNKANEILTYPSIVHYNGNDALILGYVSPVDTTILDLIGIPGINPGTAWDVAGVSGATANKTLIRKYNIINGNTDWISSAGTNSSNSEWIVLPQNEFSYIGSHPHFTPELAEVTINVNMSVQIDLGLYNPTSEFIDIAGTFNNWGTTIDTIFDNNGDSIYSITISSLNIGDTIEYKIRKNADWNNAELWMQPNRQHIITSLSESINFYYDDIEPITPSSFSWSFTNTGTSHSILIQNTAPISIDGIPISIGDYIGVFYDSLGTLACGGFDEWTGSNLALTVWGDDSQSTQPDGFTSNEIFTWKIWRASDQTEFTAFATYMQPPVMPNTDFYVTNGMSGLISLEATSVDYQYINLPQGWSYFSTYIDPFEADIDSLCSPFISNVILAKDGDGNIYWPQWSVNFINDIVIGDAYQIKVALTQVMEVAGIALVPELTPITIPQGWSMLGYIRQNSAPIDQIFNSMISEVVLVKNTEGQAFWPQWSINIIGNMNTGEGYLIKMNSQQTLTYPSNSTTYTKVETSNTSPVKYNYTRNTGTNMTIGIPLSSWETFPNPGDEIGIFTESGILIGSGVYSGENMAITIWGDDELTTIQDGIISGQEFEIRIWNGETHRESLITVNSWQQGDGSYSDNKIAIINSISTDSKDIFSLSQNIPNPFINETTFNFYIPERTKVEFSILNILGEKIDIIINEEIGSGAHSLNYNSLLLAKGTYFYKLKTENYIETRKMIITGK